MCICILTLENHIHILLYSNSMIRDFEDYSFLHVPIKISKNDKETFKNIIRILVLASYNFFRLVGLQYF